MKLVVGALVVAAHVLAFRWLATRDDASDFTVEINNGVGTPSSTRVATTMEGSAPGLVRQRWSIDYRGGFSRSAYAAQLVGPFQDPDHLACSGRVTVALSLLDDGNASEGTLAAEIEKEVTRELSGTEVWPAGAFTRVEHISVKWARLELHPDDWAMIGKAPHGYVQVSLRIGFQRVSVPMVLALIPNDPTSTARSTDSSTTGSSKNGSSTTGSSKNGSSTTDSSSKAPELSFRIVSRADFSFDNRVLQFLDDKLGGSKLATKLAREQIDGLIMTALAPPPPFALDDKPNGQTLQFTFCDQPTEVADNKWGALPFAVVIGRVANSSNTAGETILPPKHGAAPHAEIDAGSQLALDLDLDALNAILYELWRGGYLDEKLAEAGLDKTFNADPTVQSLLSIRISPPRLALPPVLAPVLGFANTRAGTSPDPGILTLSADARVTIADGAADDPDRTTTVGRVWGGLDFMFQGVAVNSTMMKARPSAPPMFNDRKVSCLQGHTTHESPFCATAVHLSELDLACERGASTASHALLAPCYSDLVAAIRDRSYEFDVALTNTFTKLLDDVFVERRLGAEGLSADLVIKMASPSVMSSGDNASLHLDLAASLVPTK